MKSSIKEAFFKYLADPTQEDKLIGALKKTARSG